jgi:hypothetical protein
VGLLVLKQKVIKPVLAGMEEWNVPAQGGPSAKVRKHP